MGSSDRKKLDILGVEVDRVTMQGALEIFSGLLETDDCSLIVTPNSEIVLNAGSDPQLAQLIKSADLVIPDGIGLVYASKMLGAPFAERVTGIDFSYEALKLLAQRGESVFLFGGKPGIAELAAEKLKEQIPGLIVAGTRNGYFKPEEEPAIASEIKASGAVFLLVALGSPKQERFIADHRAELGVRAAAGVGGSFDVWSGTLERSPKFYMDHGLEWLFRLKQEPKRIKRTARLPLFLIKVLFTGRKNGDR